MRRFDDHLLLSPSDLNDLLECRHLMALEIARFRGEPVPERARGAHTAILVRYGEQHEARVLAELEAEGCPGRADRDRAGAGPAARGDRADGCGDASTGREVIHQAALVAGGVGGYADFLERVDRPSRLGEWSYEVADAKLARTTKPYFLVQLSAYAALLERAPGPCAGGAGRAAGRRHPRHLPHRRLRRLRASAAGPRRPGRGRPRRDLSAALRALRDLRLPARLRAAAREDDHLSLVAGLAATRRASWRRPACPRWPRWPSCPRRQVPQLAARDAGQAARARRRSSSRSAHRGARYELLALRAERGFGLLPAAGRGDLFFDIEGDPYIGDQGLEYLLGWAGSSDGGERVPGVLGARPRRGAARVRGADRLLTAGAAEHPGSHIYHYAAYEVQALKRSRCTTRRARTRSTTCCATGALVDLYRVVRQGVRISKPSYSLKQVEDFYSCERDAEVKEAGGSIVAYEHWLHKRDDEALEEIEAYNREDCRSTLGLRDWLLELREERIADRRRGRAGDRDPEEPEEQRERDGRGDRRAARAAARDRRPGERRCSASCCSTTGARRSRSGGGSSSGCKMTRRGAARRGRRGDRRPRAGRRRSRRSTADRGSCRCAFPPSSSSSPWRRRRRPAQRARRRRSWSSTPRPGTLDAQARPEGQGDALPRSLIPGGPYNTDEQQAALRRLAGSVLDHGEVVPAASALLRGDLPRIAGRARGRARCRTLYDVDAGGRPGDRGSTAAAAIQGPPGTGKTYTGARIAVALMPPAGGSASTATSHKAIHNLLARGRAAGARAGRTVPRAEERQGRERLRLAARRRRDDRDHRHHRRATTRRTTCCWSPARPGCSRARAWTAPSTRCSSTRRARCRSPTRSRWRHRARNIVLLGDPQQLAQVVAGRPPRGDRGLRARAPARRRAHDAARPRAVPRRQPPHAPRRLPVRLRDQLRGRADSLPECATSGSTRTG